MRVPRVDTSVLERRSRAATQRTCTLREIRLLMCGCWSGVCMLSSVCARMCAPPHTVPPHTAHLAAARHMCSLVSLDHAHIPRVHL